MKPNAISIILCCMLSAFAVGTFTACNPEAKAISGMKVEIDIRPIVISSGFMQFVFAPNKEAYYHVGIVPVEEAPDTTRSSSVMGFMSLMLDRAYADYLYWRADLLSQGVSPVAEFPTHSLQYGTVTYNFTMLQPDKEYLVYAFAVDAQTNKPDGRLFTCYMRTEAISMYEDINFEYRVRGYWDYVYPVYFFTRGEGNQIIDYVPWVGATADSLDLVKNGYSSPSEYFIGLFDDYVLNKAETRIHYGIYAHNNNGYGDGTSHTLFESGHTYYTAIALMDGYFSDEASVLYKFHWQDENTQFLFDKNQSLLLNQW